MKNVTIYIPEYICGGYEENYLFGGEPIAFG